MLEESIEIRHLPNFKDPIFIAGFDGWGNALDISRGMIDYLIKKLDAQPIGKMNPDHFYCFDENRPTVDIKDGLLRELIPPGGSFFAAQKENRRDIILFKAVEPNLRWFRFVEAILSLCQRAGVKTIISLGSMYDNVLHTDLVISGSASSEDLIKQLKGHKIITVDYKGPSAIHSILHVEAKKMGFECMNFWCHCPYYLQGTIHFGLLSRLGALLSRLGGFDLDTEELKVTWENLSKEIQGMIDKNPELQEMVNDLRKAKIKRPWGEGKKQDKVIHLEDFLTPR